MWVEFGLVRQCLEETAEHDQSVELALEADMSVRWCGGSNQDNCSPSAHVIIGITYNPPLAL